jgi:hypothetical protein
MKMSASSGPNECDCVQVGVVRGAGNSSSLDGHPFSFVLSGNAEPMNEVFPILTLCWPYADAPLRFGISFWDSLLLKRQDSNPHEGRG